MGRRKPDRHEQRYHPGGHFQGEVWVGTADLGVNLFMGSWWEMVYLTAPDFPNNDVSGIFFDLSDNPWLNVGDGLFKYDGVSWKKIQ